MNGPFIQRVLEHAVKSEQELASAAFEEFKRLSLFNNDSTVSLESILNSMTLIAVALRWVDKPRVHIRVMDDSVRVSDRVG
jgi:hypothetical protein